MWRAARSSSTRLASALSSLACIATANASEAPGLTLSNPDYSETINSAQLVGRPKSSAAGLALASVCDHATEPGRIWVRVPTSVNGAITLRVTAADGKLLASYSLAGRGIAEQPWQFFELPSRDTSQRNALLKAYAKDGADLVAYAASPEVQKSGSAEVHQDTAEQFLFVANANPEKTRKPKDCDPALVTSLLVKSDGALSVKIQARLATGADAPLGPSKNCKRIVERDPSKFDRACETTAAELQKGVVVTRIAGSRVLPVIEVITP